MAIMFPEKCPSRATSGERLLYQFIEKWLPNERFLCWYEPSVLGRRPDFTLLGVRVGMLVLEVKSWTASQILSATPDHFTLDWAGEEAVRKMHFKHPGEQAREYMFRLSDRMQREPLLCNQSGNYQNRLAFPCGHGVFFSRLTADYMSEKQFNRLFPPGMVLCRDEMDLLESRGDAAAIEKRFRSFFMATFPFLPLTRDQVHTIRGVLYPEITVGDRPATKESIPPGGDLLPGARVLKVLDAEQEKVARAIGPGHRILFGVAGAGKSIILTAHIRALLEEMEEGKVLLLCYNMTLVGWLWDRLKGVETRCRVQVLTFRDWARSHVALPGTGNGLAFEEMEQHLGESMVAETARWQESQKYDAILIDEGMDFRPEWFTACVQATKGGEEGKLIIAVDGAQSVYRRPRGFTWKSVGVQASGRSRQLTTNYRNTREIIQFAWKVTQSEYAETGAETCPRVKPQRVVRKGPLPMYRGAFSPQEQVELIRQIVESHLQDGVASESICVLYPRWVPDRTPSLAKALKELGRISWTADGNRRRFLTEPGIRLSTIHSAKGLEFPVVIVTDVDQLPNLRYGDEQEENNLLYVALTRSTERLIITWCGGGPICDRIVATDLAQQLMI